MISGAYMRLDGFWPCGHRQTVNSGQNCEDEYAAKALDELDVSREDPAL